MRRLELWLMAFALLATIVAVVSLWLPATIWRFRQIQPPKGPLSQDEIVAVIERNRGSVTYDETAPGRPVVGVRVPIGRPADILLQYVKGLPQLRSLTLSQTNVTDAGLEHIQALKHLEVLELSRTKITDAGLDNLRSLTELRYLGLDRTNITGAGFGWLQALTDLETLILHDTKLTDPDVRCLTQHLKALPSLRYVEIGYNPKVTERAREELQKTLPHVTVR